MNNETQDNIVAMPTEEVVGEVERDTTMDISSLLKVSKEEPVVAEKPMTLLDQQLARKNSKDGYGMVVDNKELAEVNKEKKIGVKTEVDGLQEMDEYITEQDGLIKAAQSVTIERAPTSPLEMVSVMDSLSQLSEDPDKLKEIQESKKAIAITNPMARNENGEIAGSEVQTVDREDAAIEEDEDVPDVSDEKAKLINVLIDKTGYGINMDFTEEEKEKIFQASEIRVTEVEEVDLSTITIKKPQKSFVESVSEFRMGSSKVPVVFPASRFRAYMTGLTYGEMGDIALDSNNLTVDQMRKKLTVIYNKMVNPSIEFKDFEDFLRKFSFTDIEIATYGLVVATYPEVDDIPMDCRNPKCQKSFNMKFSPRSLIRFDRCADKFLQIMKEVAEAPIADFSKVEEDSPVTTNKRVKLPYSKFIVEIGLASCYDYLYTIADNLLEDKFTKNHPDDVNSILGLNAAFLYYIRSVMVPDEGGYIEYTEFEDMINALYMIKPEDIAILSTLIGNLASTYTINFELQDVKCPHCGGVTKRLALDINFLVFLKYQRLMNTTVELNNVQI